MKHVMAGVDGSEESKRAAHFAAELARQFGAKLTLIVVLERPVLAPLSMFDAYATVPGKPTPERIEEARKVVEQIPHELPAGRVDSVVELGSPAEVLIDRAKALNVDHIVVGSRGLGAAGRWLLGSISDRVVRHAQCPVTVVR